MHRWSKAIGLLAGFVSCAIALGYVVQYLRLVPEVERADYKTARLAVGVVLLAGVGTIQILAALRPTSALRAGVLTGCAVVMLLSGLFGAVNYDPLALIIWFAGFPALFGAGLAGAAARPHNVAGAWMLIGAVVAGALLWGVIGVLNLLTPSGGL